MRLPEAVEDPGEGSEAPLERHIVVVGAGLNGTNVARVLLETGIRHVLVDIDPERVAAARHEGLHVLRADATGLEGLHAAGVERALGVVVTIPDPDACRRVVRLARTRNPDVRILVRTRYVKEVETLRALGADEVIPEEFETSIELVARVLRLLHVPGNVVATQIRLLSGLDLATAHVAVPVVLRDGVPYAPPPDDLRLAAGDTLVLVGAHEDLARVVTRLEMRAAAPAAG